MRISPVNTRNVTFLSQNSIGITSNNPPKNISIQDVTKSETIQEKQKQELNQEKVSWSEAFSLMGKGFANKIKTMITSVVEHPIATIATAGLTTAVIGAAPLIGISSAVAGSCLAIGFAGYAIFNTGKDVIETIKDNNAGRYDEVRQDLCEIGGDAVDLALSLPCLPRAIKTVKNSINYGPGIAVNETLINDLKNGEGIYKSFKKADIGIEYETIGKQMGFEVKPELEYIQSSIKGFHADYNDITGKIGLSNEYLNPVGNLKKSLSGHSVQGELTHELIHYRQYCDIARELGVDGLKSVLQTRYKEGVKNAVERIATPNTDIETSYKNVMQQIKDLGLDATSIENITNGDGTMFNAKLYEQAIESPNVVYRHNGSSATAQEYINTVYSKTTPSYDYSTDIMEVEARAAQHITECNTFKIPEITVPIISLSIFNKKIKKS